MGSLTVLAEEALEHAKALDEYLVAQGLPSTSFENDSLADLPLDLIHHRNGLINSSQTLKQLAQGPATVLLELGWACTNEISLGAIYDHQLAEAVPLDGSTTFADIARVTGQLSEDLVERLLRHAMNDHVFTEDPPGFIRHTASSRLLAIDSTLNDLVGFRMTETWQAAGHTRRAIINNSNAQEPRVTGFGLANQTGDAMFEHLSKYPNRTKRFGGAMQAFAKFGGWDLKYLIQGYAWDRLDKPGATIVDVGGGQGAVTCAIAKATENVQFIVQDLAGTIADGKKVLPSYLQGRVSFMEHDFFAEQPIKAAEVYFFRWILHDWSDENAVRILRSLVPALRDGSKIILYEVLLADGPETRLTESYGRNADLIMLAQYNAKERTTSAFKKLIKAADERLHVINISRPRGSSMDLIEVVWTS